MRKRISRSGAPSIRVVSSARLDRATVEIPERRSDPDVANLVDAPRPSVAIRSSGSEPAVGCASGPSARGPPLEQLAVVVAAAEHDQAVVVQPPAAQVRLVGTAPVAGKRRATYAP